jgi:alpha-beta hydrolase superfamily lysophospholipase
LTDRQVVLTAADGVPIHGTWHAATPASCRRAVVLGHGLQMDRSEAGLFDKLAASLAAEGMASLRFDFRGHGTSGGDPAAMTITGECLDMQAAVRWTRAQTAAPVGVLGASFGAVSAISAAAAGGDVAALVLWYPVLDLVQTFVKAQLPGMRATFNEQSLALLETEGFIALSPAFRLGKPLITEMKRADPLAWLLEVQVPVLTVHGDRDSYVPYAVAALHGAPNGASHFLGLAGAEHGFPSPPDAEVALRATLRWFDEHLPSTPDA